MSETELIVAATILLVSYFGLTYRFRISADKHRLRALSFAKKLSKSEHTPESVRRFIANRDVLGAKSIAPWIVVFSLPFIAIAAAFSKRDDQMLADVEKAGEEIDRLFSGFLDSSARSSILRSPLAFLIVVVEASIVALVFAAGHHFLNSLKGGLKSVFTYFYISLDDYDLRGITVFRFK